jgi:hypothetical protein
MEQIDLKPGTFVRIARKYGKSPHHGRGSVVSVGAGKALIKPLGRYRHDIEVDLGDVRIWKSKQRLERAKPEKKNS